MDERLANRGKKVIPAALKTTTTTHTKNLHKLEFYIYFL